MKTLTHPAVRPPEIGEGLRQLRMALAWRACARQLELAAQPTDRLRAEVIDAWLRQEWFPGLRALLEQIPTEILGSAERLEQAADTIQALFLECEDLQAIISRSDTNQEQRRQDVQEALEACFAQAAERNWQQEEGASSTEVELPYLDAREMAAAWISQAQACLAWDGLRVEVQNAEGAPDGTEDSTPLLEHCADLIRRINHNVGTDKGWQLWHTLSSLHSPVYHQLLKEARTTLLRCHKELSRRPPAPSNTQSRTNSIADLPTQWLAEMPSDWPPRQLLTWCQAVERGAGKFSQPYLMFLAEKVLTVKGKQHPFAGPGDQFDLSLGEEARALLLRLSCDWVCQQGDRELGLWGEEKLLLLLAPPSGQGIFLEPKKWCHELIRERQNRIGELFQRLVKQTNNPIKGKELERYRAVIEHWAAALVSGSAMNGPPKDVCGLAKNLFRLLYEISQTDPLARRLAASLYRQLQPAFGVNLLPTLDPEQLTVTNLPSLPLEWVKEYVASPLPRGTVVAVDTFGESSYSPQLLVSMGADADPRLQRWLSLPLLGTPVPELGAPQTVLIDWKKKVEQLLGAKPDEITEEMNKDRTTFQQLLTAAEGAEWFNRFATTAQSKEGPERRWLQTLKKEKWIPGCYPDLDEKGMVSWPGDFPVVGNIQYQFNPAAAPYSIVPKRFSTQPELAECTIKLGGEVVNSSRGKAARHLLELARKPCAGAEVIREPAFKLFALTFRPCMGGQPPPAEEVFDSVLAVLRALDECGRKMETVREQEMGKFLDRVLLALEEWGKDQLKILPKGWRYLRPCGESGGVTVTIGFDFHPTVPNGAISETRLGLQREQPPRIEKAKVRKSLGPAIPGWQELKLLVDQCGARDLQEQLKSRCEAWLRKKADSEDAFRQEGAQFYEQLWELNSKFPRHETEIQKVRKQVVQVLQQYFHYTEFSANSPEEYQQLKDYQQQTAGNWFTVIGNDCFKDRPDVETLWPGLQSAEGNLVAAVKIRLS